MDGYEEIIGDAVHDLQHLIRLHKEGHIQDHRLLLAILSTADNLKSKAINEAKLIRTHPVLFAV